MTTTISKSGNVCARMLRNASSSNCGRSTVGTITETAGPAGADVAGVVPIVGASEDSAAWRSRQLELGEGQTAGLRLAAVELVARIAARQKRGGAGVERAATRRRERRRVDQDIGSALLG